MMFWFSLLFLASAQAVTPTVDDLVKEPVLFTGPNCFNTAFRALGVQSVRRHVTAAEVDTLLQTHCRKTDKKVGAFGLLRENQNQSAFHGFVVLENEKVLTKNGFSKVSKNEIQTQVKMTSVHENAFVSQCEKKGTSGCALTAEYWQCESAADVHNIEMMWDGMLSSRETMFSADIQKRLLQKASVNSKALCSDPLLAESFVLGFEYANYASITPEEFAQLNETSEQFQALLKSLCPQ